MDHLWAPWRFAYIKGEKVEGCVFCRAAAGEDGPGLVVHRAHFNFVLLNRYPYTSGHLMIAPYQHANRLQAVPEEVALEMMSLARTAEQVLQEIYRPGGLNMGLNLGEAAGAGIEEHIHLHVLPRWKGDANFMTSVGNTRVLPEDLDETYVKVRAGFVEQFRKA